MAMNEDSVVSSLNELRRMANERARRETEQRARVEAERRAFDDRSRASRRSESRPRVSEVRNDPRTRTLTEGFSEAPKPANVEPFSSMARWEQTDTSPAPTEGMYAQTAPMGSGTQDWRAVRGEPGAVAPPVRARSSAGPVILTILVMGAVGVLGFFKLRQDQTAMVKLNEQKMVRMEEARNQAVEAASRAEQQLKVQAAAYDQRMHPAAAAPAGAAPAAVDDAAAGKGKWAAAAGGAPGAKAAGPGRFHRRWWRSRGAGRRAAAAAAAAAAGDPKPPLPSIARKKKVSDDPLDGLKL